MKVSDRIIWRKIENEIFIVDPLNERIHELNETASFIFSMINENKNKYEILKKMVEEYNVDEDVCRKDLDDIISDFISKGIIDEK